MKKLLLLLLVAFLPMMASAQDYILNGIVYEIGGNGAEVMGIESGVTEVDIPSSIEAWDQKFHVTTIRANAFEGHSDITYLSIPYSIKSIGADAFKNCGSHITVNIADPESWCQMKLANEHSSPLSSAGKMLVHDKETTTIDIPETVTSISAFTFYQCSCLKTLNIPSSVTSISSSAFEDCDYLTSVNLSDGLQKIGGSAFEGCKSLTTITIPSTVNAVKVNAFKNCTGLQNVYCEATSVPEADATSFVGLPSNATLRIPKGTKDKYMAAEGWNTFPNIVEMGEVVEHLYFETPNADGVTIYYSGVKGNTEVEVTYKGDDDPLDFYGYYEGRIVIPETVEYKGKTYKVTGINHDTFNQCPNVTSVVIPNSVTTIGERAFIACSKMYSIVIPKNVTSIEERAFYGCKMLTHVVSEIENPFSIDDNVFEGISSNPTLIVPKGTRSKYKAANGWKKFPNIVEGTKYITYYGFEKANADGVTIYYRWANWGTEVEVSCKGDDSLDFLDEYTGNVVIPESVDYDGKTFSVTGIDMEAFNLCTGLTSVTIPKSVTTIGERAFMGCTGLATVISMIEKPFAIDKNVFDHIPSNATLMVPYGTKAKYQATEGWNQFKNIIEDGGEGSEFEIDGIRYSVGVDNIVAIISCDTKFTGDLVIPNEVKYHGTTYTVNGIGWGAFLGCTGIESVTISEGVKWIHGRAFADCSNLTSLTIPSSLGHIGDCAFEGCSKLSKVYISNLAAFLDIEFEVDEGPYSNPLYYAQYLFLNGIEIKDIVIPNTIKKIRTNAFGGFKSLNSVTIPNSVTSIGAFAFMNCTSLAIVISEIEEPFVIDETVFSNIPSDATLIVPKDTKAKYQVTEGWSQFKNIIEDGGEGSEFEIDGIRYSVGKDNTVTIISCDTKPTGNLVIPNEVEYKGTTYTVDAVGLSAFSDCTGIESVTISEGVTLIDDRAFAGCSNLTSLKIPSSLENIDDCAFEGCSKLTNVYISDLTAFLEIEFEVKEGLFSNPLFYAQHLFLDGEIRDIVIPNTVKKIKTNAFGGFKSLNSVTIPNSVTSIGDYAFSGCSGLTSLTLHEDLESIGAFAFTNCTGLNKVFCLAEDAPTMADNAFDGVWDTVTLLVHYANEDAYKQTSPWDIFSNITHLPIITYVIDGEVYDRVELSYGAEIVPPVVEQREGYEFAWGDYPETMPDEDVIIEGSYVATAINGVKAEATDANIYSINGCRTSKLQRGLNIIRQSDGKVRKVLVR